MVVMEVTLTEVGKSYLATFQRDINKVSEQQLKTYTENRNRLRNALHWSRCSIAAAVFWLLMTVCWYIKYGEFDEFEQDIFAVQWVLILSTLLMCYMSGPMFNDERIGQFESLIQKYTAHLAPLKHTINKTLKDEELSQADAITTVELVNAVYGDVK